MAIAIPADRPASRRRTLFFVAIAGAMLVVIALGFGRSFYARPWFTDRPLPAYLIVHGVAMTAWYLLFLAQGLLVRAGRVDLHRTFGAAGVALAAVIVGTAIVVNLNRVPRMEALGLIRSPADRELALAVALDSLSSMVAFAAVFSAALAWRRTPGVHRRLMFWSSVWMLGPAFTAARPLGAFLDPLVAPYLPFFPADVLWLLALIAFDVKTERRVHPATYLGFLGLASYFLVVSPLLASNATLQAWLQGYANAHPYVLP